ncbi:MAG: hypothetical protein IKU19_07135 [Clostridia bacterium]|nr:hypothetical protein [Clostridia bacterium]
MEGIREFVYSILIVSVSGAVITMFAPENPGISKYLRFLVGIVITFVLLLPVAKVIGELPDLVPYEIEFDLDDRDASVYTETVVERTCKEIGAELSEDLSERFDITPAGIDIISNGDVEALEVVSVAVYYGIENSLLYSDTVKYIEGIFGKECEVAVLYEDTEP